MLSLFPISRGAPSQGTAGDVKPANDIDEFVIGPLEITVPQGRFLLIRKDQEVGALIFTNIELTKTDDQGKAKYESYFQGDGSGALQNVNVIKEVGSIDLKHLKGVGRISFQTGHRKIRIGKWSFASDYPGRITMWPYRGEQRDYGYEFAPTSAQNISQIDVSDRRLHWFRYLADKTIIVPVSDLPK
jgi:hypothetical protein